MRVVKVVPPRVEIVLFDDGVFFAYVFVHWVFGDSDVFGSFLLMTPRFTEVFMCHSVVIETVFGAPFFISVFLIMVFGGDVQR